MLLEQSQDAADARNADFDSMVRASLRRIRSALIETLSAIGADPTRPTVLARQLGLDKNLAWKVSRIATDEDLLGVVPRLPGRSGVRILLESLSRSGASDESLEMVKAAFINFDDMAERQAGDRDTLERMLSSSRRGSAGESEEAHRKQAFQGQSAVWGVQARVRVATYFVLPSAAAGKLDLATLSGLVDFRRLRPDVPWPVASVRVHKDDGSAIPIGTPTPLDPGLKPGDVPVMRQFCTGVLPTLRAVPARDGFHRIEIGEGPVGNAGAANCFIGYVSRAIVEPRRTGDDRFGEHQTLLNTPAELAVMDLVVHRSLAFARRPRFALYSMLPGGPVYPFEGRERGLLPLSESVVDLGPSSPDLTLPEVPRYQSMVETALAQLGASPADFFASRLKLRYPPVPSLGVFRYDLPEA
jgi:hypothetical protein